MKKYKLSERSYRESMKVLAGLHERPLEGDQAKEKAGCLQRKISIKLAMCAYYQG